MGEKTMSEVQKLDEWFRINHPEMDDKTVAVWINRILGFN